MSHARFPRVFRWFSLIAIGLMLGTLLTPAHADDIVEQWRGTITAASAIDTNTYTFGMLPGWQRDRATLRYDLKVDQSGFVSGVVEATLDALSLTLTSFPGAGSVCLAGGLLNCTATYTIVQPSAVAVVDGQRFVDSTGRPAIKFTKINTSQHGKINFVMCGLALGFIPDCERGDSEWTPNIPAEYTITPYEGGRPPLAEPKNANVSQPDLIIHYDGQMVGVGQEPVLDLDPELLERNTFISQVRIDNRLDANVDWNSADAGWITWQLAQDATQRVGPTRSKTVSDNVDVGFSSPGSKLVQVQAHNTLNKDSRPETLQLTAAPPPNPKMSGPPSNITGTKNNNYVAYTFNFKFPDPAFEAVQHVPEAIPFFGGGDLGIPHTQASGEVEVDSTGDGFAKAAVEAEFDAMKGKIGGGVSAKSQVKLDAGGLSFPSGEFEVKISGKLPKEEPMLKVIPALTGPVSAIEKLSPAAGKVLNVARVGIEIAPKISLNFKLKDNQGDLEFVAGQAQPGIGIKGSVILELIKDVLSVTGTIGGEVNITVQVPSPYFQGVSGKLLASAKVVLYHWAYEGEASYNFSFGGPSLMTTSDGWYIDRGGASSSDTTSTWKLLDRSYLNEAGYGQWTAQPSSPDPDTTGKIDEQLIAKVFPQANPSLTILQNTAGLSGAIVAWTHDRPGTPALSGQEIAFALNDGSGWDQGPLMLTNDDRADFNPKAVYLPNNAPLIGWQRFDTATPGDLNTNPAAYLSHLQIAAARASENAKPVQISTSGSLNYRPQFAATPTGAVAVWINNPANQLLGDTAHPDTLLFSRYTPGTYSQPEQWTAPARVTLPMGGLVDYSLATAAGHTALVYSRDMDGDLATTNDRELFSTTLTNMTWSTPVRLTTNTVADEAPQLALTDAGAPLVVWRQNNAMRFLSGSWTAPSQPLPLPAAAARTDYELVRSAAGAMALTWEQPTASDTRIGYAIYDAAMGRWSDKRTIEPPAQAPGKQAVVSQISPALLTGQSLSGQPRVMAAYVLAPSTPVTRTLNGVQYPNVLINGTPSLNVVQEQLQTNLTITPFDLSATPDTAKANDPVTIHAAVHNTGNFAVSNVPVQLISPAPDLGDPDTIIMTRTLPLLNAGSTYTMTFPTKRPALADRSLAVTIPVSATLLGPGGYPLRNLETDYSDNTATVGAHLLIRPMPAITTPNGTIAQAAITQRGGIYSSASTTATLRLDAEDGPIIGMTGVSFPITPTATITASSWITTTGLSTGHHALFWEVDPGGSFGDPMHDNHTTVTALNILPDLTTDAALVGWDRNPGTAPAVNLRVRNDGNRSSPASVVEIYDGPPGTTGVHRIGSIPIPAIPPGDYRELTGTLNLTGLPAAKTGIQTLYVSLDPAAKIAELNENNNLIRVGGRLGPPYPDTGLPDNPIFLPLLQRGS